MTLYSEPAIAGHPTSRRRYCLAMKGVRFLASVLVVVFGIATGPLRASSEEGSEGYWLAGADGGVFAFGDAPFLGSASGLTLQAPIVGIASTATGQGYWLAGADGGVFAFGDAPFLGVGGVRKCEAEDLRGGCALRSGLEMVGFAASTRGVGCAMVDVVGGITNFGSAEADARPCPIASSTESTPLLHSNACATAIASTPGGGFVVSWFDGTVESSRGAPTCERPADVRLPRIVAIAVNEANDGCWLAGVDGGVFSLSRAQFLGSMGNIPLRSPIVGLAPARL